ncbi:MAG: Arc family DNA-binding protein [Chloroflexota bacterium]|nr:Arc family DNA-binding protein [Chloroflexota bacterium]
MEHKDENREDKVAYVRMPVEMHKRLLELARKNRRSLTAHILFILEQYLEENDKDKDTNP